MDCPLLPVSCTEIVRLPVNAEVNVNLSVRVSTFPDPLAEAPFPVMLQVVFCSDPGEAIAMGTSHALWASLKSSNSEFP